MFTLKKIFKNAIIFYFVLSFVGCVSTPSSKKKPEWVDNTKSVYSDSKYVSAVGEGKSRTAAEDAALGNLSKLFSTTVSVTQTITDRYKSVFTEKSSSGSQDTDMMEQILTSSKQSSLVGATIEDVWQNSDGQFYAVAVMNRQKTSLFYSNKIREQTEDIENLIASAKKAKNPLDAYAAYSFAVVIAEVNNEMLSLLSVVDSVSWKLNQPSYGSVNSLKMAASDIAQKITIKIVVNNDQNKRINSAFSSVFNNMNFKVWKGLASDKTPDYLLNVDFSLEEAVLKNNDNKFCRFIIDADFTEVSSGKTLTTYSVNGRDGNVTYAEAVQKTLRTAEKKIKSEYQDNLEKYLDSFVGKL